MAAVAATAAAAAQRNRKPGQVSVAPGGVQRREPGQGGPASPPRGVAVRGGGDVSTEQASGTSLTARPRSLPGGAAKPMPEATSGPIRSTELAPRYQRMLDRGVDPAFVEARQAQHAAGTLPGQLQKPPVEAGGGMMGAGPRPLPGYGQPKPLPAETIENSGGMPAGASSVPPEIEGRMAQLARERGINMNGVALGAGGTLAIDADRAYSGLGLSPEQRALIEPAMRRQPSVSEMPMELPRNLQSITGGGLRGFGVGGAGMAPPDQAPPAAAEGGSPFAGLAQASMLSRLQGMNGGGLQGLPQAPLSGSPRLGNASLDTLRDPRLVRNSMAGF